MREALGFLAVVAELAQWKVMGDDFGLDFSDPGGGLAKTGADSRFRFG